ncbi:tRNA-His guanylyltransferase [Trapelia coarctata]|nr:tRNA-His guanylyltransferase [Trapelia coarctata]
MANSKYEYVKSYEKDDTLLPSTYLVVRIDGRGFHKVSRKYEFEKPNDRRALDLMNAATAAVMKELPDIFLAYGISDEVSFAFDKNCNLFDRRESKIITTVVSTFTSYYIFLWASFFPAKPLSFPLPTFDGRAVLYPSDKLLRDYMSWRQVDCHINNLYNTTFWALVDQGGLSSTQAEERLKGTSAADKNEILFASFTINYNNETDIFKKGSTIYRAYEITDIPVAQNEPDSNTISKTQIGKEKKKRSKATIITEHVDLIKDAFWENRSWLLSGKST